MKFSRDLQIFSANAREKEHSNQIQNLPSQLSASKLRQTRWQNYPHLAIDNAACGSFTIHQSAPLTRAYLCPAERVPVVDVNFRQSKTDEAVDRFGQSVFDDGGGCRILRVSSVRRRKRIAPNDIAPNN